MEYKKGDVIEICSKPNSWWNREMFKYAGTIATIYNISHGNFYIEEDKQYWSWNVEKDIAGMASEEIILQKKEEARIKKEQFKEKYKSLIFTMEAVEAIAVGIFGEKRVDVHKYRKDEFDVIIHFPEIEITNSRGQHHTIKDILVKYNVNIYEDRFEEDDFKAEISFEGKRQTLSLKEYESQYRHSHSHRGQNTFCNFCLGNSDYSSILTHLAMELTENAWMTAFLALENYLKWESIEGGPHMNMQDIKYNNRITENGLKDELKTFLKHIPRECWEFNSGVRLITAHPYLYNCINEHSKIRKLNYYTKEEEQRKIEQLNEMYATDKSSSIKWKGENWPLTIYSENVETGHVGRDLVEEYSNIITKQGADYIKTYQYERKRQQYKEKVFGKI